MILKQMGVDLVHEASDGQEALQKFEDFRPDAVLMDINMPGMTGVEALEAIQKIDSNAIVIMLTAQASRQLIEECQRAGATYYIRKDTPRPEIVTLLQEVFDSAFV